MTTMRTLIARTVRTLIPTLLIPALLIPAVLTGQVSVIGDLSQDRETPPGEVYEGSILVRNDTKETQEAKVYQADYRFDCTGANYYEEPGSHARSNAAWILFSPSFFSIPPQSNLTVTYRVTVPKDSAGRSLSGTYWSMLMVEGVSRGSGESSRLDRNKKEMGLTQTIRYGVQVATHIAGTGARIVKFRDARFLLESDGSRFLQVDVENSGDRGIRPEMYAEVFDAKGISRGKFPGTLFRMYPGTSVRQRIDMSGLPAGQYKVLFVVDAGGDEAFAAEYSLKI
jgi:hypothetical protein